MKEFLKDTVDSNGEEQSKTIKDDFKGSGGIEDLEVIEETEEKGYSGENNAAPLEMTEDVIEEIMEKQGKDDVIREETSSKTNHFNNELNVWRLISKSYNDVLQWEHTTMAMQIGTRGVILYTKEVMGNKVACSSVVLVNAHIGKTKDDKYFVS